MRYVDSLNDGLRRLMADEPRAVLLGEDILDPYGGAFKVTRGLSTAFPDRVLATPISEAALTGFATGMAIRGFRPVLEIMFGDFLTLCTDQLVNGAAKFAWMYNGQVSVPLVIRTPMGGRRGYGPTHSQTLETLFLGVPELRIAAPSHLHDAGALLYHTVRETASPVLFIENKLLYPRRVDLPDHDGRLDAFFVEARRAHDPAYPSIVLKLADDAPPDAVLVAYGGMAPPAMEAAMNVFMREETVVEVVVPSLIKPFPIDDVLPSLERCGRVVIAEEAVRTAGWGAELACRITEAAFSRLERPVRRIGAKETPIPSARSLERETLPDVEDIEQAIMEVTGGPDA